eukprot:TRINITY_DN9389_c0_g1_i5.p1 TRINITY_DN9389_c0_g1~~TRINITY_DN9389_c0_g1_i5.p1  ORF type:complete len:154 (+),score=18.39 TRINITY_DN9389_c0_g1_i5:373-834(+)
MKHYADQRRTEREFQVGNMVYLKLQPYRQSSLASRPNQKLAAKYFEPYRILERAGQVAYKLDLPARSGIHPVIHVSQLKHRGGTNIIPTEHLLPTDPHGEIKLNSEAILYRKIIKQGNQVVTRVLVKWSNLDPSEATWEDYTALKHRFPSMSP